MNDSSENILYLNQDHIDQNISRKNGEFYIFINKMPGKNGNNEDSAGIFLSPDGRQSLLCVADGMGGAPQGDKASMLVLTEISQAIHFDRENNTRSMVLDGIETANTKIQDLKTGSGATCIAIEIENHLFRTYHAGDSCGLVISQRGRIKYQTLSHSPVAYALESGEISEEEALQHNSLHEISNFVGHPEMRIEIGPQLKLAKRDTVIIGSDGLFDNLRIDELIHIVRTGKLENCGRTLAEKVNERMGSNDPEHPSKPDDIAFILYRPA
jgi:serine/threonine protein phosphatase PrpC